MKKIILIVITLVLLSSIAFAGKMRWAVGLTGGGDALDGIVSPSAGDTTMVFQNLTSTTNATLSIYYAVTGSAAESSPNIIAPNTDANGVRWYLLRKFASVPEGTGFVTETSSLLTLVSKGTSTSSLLGVDSGGNIGLYSNITLNPMVVPSGSSLPATCSINMLYSLTTGTAGCKLHLCESTNTWVRQGVCP